MTKSANNQQMPQQKVGLKKQATSTELTGGAGFTFEDKVVAYYLAALLRCENAMLQQGTVSSVAVQQAGHGQPMDDLIVEFRDADGPRMLGLQVKSTITISAAPTNEDFRDVVKRARESQLTPSFQPNRDVHGYVAENVAEAGHRSLNRLISWAVSSPAPTDFAQRFAEGGASGSVERILRDKLAPLIGANNVEEEWNFYRQFVAARLTGFDETGIVWIEVTNRLQELVASNEDGQATLLLDRLCRIVRDGAGTARKWTRTTLLTQLRGVIRLKVSPSFRDDIDILGRFSTDGLNEIDESIDGFEVDRAALQNAVYERLNISRVVNISGLPGCGKSVVLKRVAAKALQRGPILFLKSDRLAGKSWVEFAAALGIRHRKLDDLLVEIGATGTAILYIDGIDRINPDQKRIIIDVLKTIEGNPDLGNWSVLATSRDQGLETYRAWFPATFYNGTQIGDVQVKPFNDEEADALAKEKPGLHHLLKGAPSVQAIARRPFFAAVLTRSFNDGTTEPQTEVDLINAWWARAGHDASAEVVPQRQRALIDIAEKGVANLGKNVSARSLSPPTFEQIGALKSDLLVRGNNGDASYSFTHDIFFEWTFFRLLIELGETWIDGLKQAGEPPLLGRVVGLLAQHSIAEPGKWVAGYAALNRPTLRPQWRREWLTAPPFTSVFSSRQKEFTKLVTSNDYVLVEKVLVWFQAQHTIPSPTVLAQPSPGQSGIDRVGLAELLSWPSDFTSWGRFLDWLLPIAPTLPIRLLPIVVEVFSVWQNAFSEFATTRSKAIVTMCAEWLIDFEKTAYPPAAWVSKYGKWDEIGYDAQKQFATALRIIIMRAARAIPEHANALFDRAVSNKRMRDEAYSDLMAFTWMMVEVSPKRVAAVTKAEIQRELPQDQLDRENREQQARAERIKRIRDKPEGERTESEKSALEHSYFHIPHSYGGLGRDEIGIDGHHEFYYPISAMHEPFASLFAKKSDVALELVCDLSNHGTTGWRQVANINRNQRGTPIPVTIVFPWGEQQFWGDWPAYNWQLGQLGAQPLECAYLAMSYWAFRQIESGRPIDEVIQSVVQGNEAIAAPGLALRLALETFHISEVTLALVSCQRLWPFDIGRVRNEPMRNIDLLGLGQINQLSGEKKVAEDYLDKRLSRFRDVQQLAMQFVVNGDKLTERFTQALANFVVVLPYEVEEQRSNPTVNAALSEQAKKYAALAIVENYRGYRTPDKQIVVAYQPPLSPETVERGEAAAMYLQQNDVLGWAMNSLRAFALSQDKTLADAVTLARPLDHHVLFAERFDVEEHTPQSLVAAVAACVICFGDAASDDYKWAMNVLGRVDRMKELPGSFGGSKIAWHPMLQLIFALLHLRRMNPSELEPARRLFLLTAHAHEDAADFAFASLLADPDVHVSWVAAQLALERALHYRPAVMKGGRWNTRADETAAEAALDRALKGLNSKAFESFIALPLAWVKLTSASEDGNATDDDDGWIEPDPSFNPKRVDKYLRNFPIEKWCASDATRPLVLELLRSLVTWSALRIKPPGGSGRRHDRVRGLTGWNDALGDVLARAAPFFEIELVKTEFFGVFFQNHEENELDVIASFTDSLVRRHVLDAVEIPVGIFDFLSLCVDYVIADRTFLPGGYRAGEVSGHDMPKLIEALLMVNVERAPGAARFVNGDWSEIDLIMPTVTRLITAVGWSTFVMSKFLLLCQRVGTNYPLDSFIQQVGVVLSKLDNAKGNWAGTSLASRMAVTVQRLADANFPLRADQAQGLLWILDALVDLGDRRSVALEQTEAFKGVQARSSIQ